MKTLIAILLVALMVMPLNADFTPTPTPDQDTWVALCLVAAAGVAVGIVYIAAKRCKPRYYWLLNPENGDIWLGTCSKKQKEIEGWEKIGGPYVSIQDAPPVHPSITNRVNDIIAEPIHNFTVEQSTDNQNWIVCFSATNTIEEFIYFPTNAAMFRIAERVP